MQSSILTKIQVLANTSDILLILACRIESVNSADLDQFNQQCLGGGAVQRCSDEDMAYVICGDCQVVSDIRGHVGLVVVLVLQQAGVSDVLVDILHLAGLESGGFFGVYVLLSTLAKSHSQESVGFQDVLRIAVFGPGFRLIITLDMED